MARSSALVLLGTLSVALAHSPLLPFAPFLPDGLAPITCPPRAANDNDADFLILGAGMAGLGAAHYLHAHTRGCIIRVLEARDVPGGRVRTLQTGPFAGMEIGAGWIHEYIGNPMLAVADANGIYTKWVGGNSSYVGGEKIRIFDNGTELDTDKRRNSYNIASLLTAGIELEASKRVKLELPDTSVLETVMNLTGQLELSPFEKRLARWNLDVIYGGDWAVPMRNLSIKGHEHGYLNYEGGDCVFPDGFLQIPEALALGVDVHYDSMVRSIKWSADRVEVSTEDGGKYDGRKLLLTQSIGVLQSNLLSFSPPLPKNKMSAINQLGMANLNRIMLRFPAPFWSNDTYTLGFLPDSSPLYLDPDEDDEDLEEWLTEPLLSVAVNAAYEDRPVGPGAVLTFMVGGDSSPKLQARSEGKLVARVMQHIRAAFGANVPAPTHVHVSDWAHEPLARGSYSFVPVGTPLHAGAAALATPVAHTLFFAGEATLAGPARGTTHGAFLSGIREAARMLGRARVVERVWSADAASITIAEGRSVSSQANRGSMVVDDWFTVPRSKLVVQE